jgi:hypothetical protein
MNCPHCGASLPTAVDPTAREIDCPECAKSVDLTATFEGTQEITGLDVPVKPGDPLLGRTIGGGRYRIDSLLGRGGMGTVYRGTQLNLGREVAIKVLSPELTGDEAFIRRFRREAGTLAAFQHPNIVTIHDTGDDEGIHHIVMAYVSGDAGEPMSLRQLMDSGPLDVDLALRIAAQTCAALEYAHDRGIVHRDIKPGNILLDGSWNAHVADFGIARVTSGVAGEPTLTVAGSSMGTLKYMAPEQKVDATRADARSDVYAVGVVLYEMLTGEVPEGRFEMPTEVRGDTDARVDVIVERALRRSPEQRYPTAGEMERAIERARAIRATGPQTIQPMAAAPAGTVVTAPPAPAPPPAVTPTPPVATPPPAVPTPPPAVPTPPPATPTHHPTPPPVHHTPPPATPTPVPAAPHTPPPATPYGHPTTPPPTAPRKKGKGWIIVLPILLLVGLIVVAIVIAAQDGDDDGNGGDPWREGPEDPAEVDEPDWKGLEAQKERLAERIREQLSEKGQLVESELDDLRRQLEKVGGGAKVDTTEAEDLVEEIYDALLDGEVDYAVGHFPERVIQEQARISGVAPAIVRGVVRQKYYTAYYRDFSDDMRIESAWAMRSDWVLVRYTFTNRSTRQRVQAIANVFREKTGWKVALF